MVWPHHKILWHSEDNSAGGGGEWKEQEIKEFGDSLKAAEDSERWKGIVATSSVVKGLRWDEVAPSQGLSYPTHIYFVYLPNAWSVHINNLYI